MKKFEFLEHTADVKFRAFGKNIEEVFSNSALAMKEKIYDEKIKKKAMKKIKVQGKDFESLLYIFLEKFLYLLEGENFIFDKIKKIKIDKEKFKLEAEVSGDKASSYDISNPVKAVTYNEMFVKKEREKWISQVVLDV
ncbi:MAG: archease [Nanoarchaeota archaeon]|nr:archease [Nanoarchaeota archaeon]